MVVCGCLGGAALGADPGRPAGVLPDERDHHLADAQLRRRLPAHLPDLPDRVVLAPDDGLQRLGLPDRARRCPPRRSGRRGRSTSRAASPSRSGSLIACVIALRPLVPLPAHPVRLRGAGALRLGAGRALRRRPRPAEDPGRDGDLRRHRRHRRREPGRRLQPLTRRRPERAPEARLRLHRDRRRRARPLQPVRDAARRLPDRRARERRQHAPGPGLPGRPRRRARGDHPLLRARRRAPDPQPRPDLPPGPRRRSAEAAR